MPTYNQGTIANQYYTNTNNPGGLGKSNYATLQSAFGESPLYPGSPFYGSTGPFNTGHPDKYATAYAAPITQLSDFGAGIDQTGKLVADQQNASAYWGITQPGASNNGITTLPFDRDYGDNNPPDISLTSTQISTTSPGDPSSPFTPNVASPGELAGQVNVDPANQAVIVTPSVYDAVNYPDQYGSDTLDTLEDRNPAKVSDSIDDNELYGSTSYKSGKSHNY